MRKKCLNLKLPQLSSFSVLTRVKWNLSLQFWNRCSKYTIKGKGRVKVIRLDSSKCALHIKPVGVKCWSVKNVWSCNCVGGIAKFNPFTAG